MLFKLFKSKTGASLVELDSDNILIPWVLTTQVEAQEAIVRDVSNLCDVAEAMCNAQEEQLNQSLINLPIWAAPHELIASLCDD